MTYTVSSGTLNPTQLIVWKLDWDFTDANFHMSYLLADYS